MSARKSRVRPVPDFSRAHQLLELQLEARKKDMKKCTKVEEFNLSRGFVRADGSSATPIHGLDISKPSPRLPDFQRLQTNQIQSPAVSSTDVKVPKPTDCTTMNCATGLQRKAAAGILKNTGKTDEAATGQRQARCAGATLGRRPRVTFDIASPLRKSPISMPRRVRVSGWSCSPSKGGSPKPAASRMLIACNRIPVEPRNRTAQSTRSERSQPRRVLMFGSGQRLTASQSCSRAACMGGYARFRAGSIAKAIDFNEEEEEEEEDGKSAVQGASEDAEQPVETAIGVKTMKKFHGLKSSPVRKIHVDVDGNEDASMSSPLLRFNSNSDGGVIRSPLLTKMERIARKDAKNRSRLPQPKDLRRKANKENRSEEMKRKSRDDSRASMTTDDGRLSEFDKSTECRVGKSQDQRTKLEATSRSGKRDALEQMETVDVFDANQTISKLEKKAQRLRRRSQLTEEKSEQDYIMKKLEILQKKIESMRMVFHSMCQGDSSGAGGDGGSLISTSDDLGLGRPMRDVSNVCLTESRSIDDARPDVPAVESKAELQLSEVTFENPAVTSETVPESREPEFKENDNGSNALVHLVSEILPELNKESQLSNPLTMDQSTMVCVVSESAVESRVDELSDISLEVLQIESEWKEDLKSDVASFVSEIELRSADNMLCGIPHDVAVENEVEEGLTERQAEEQPREMESEALGSGSPVHLLSDVPAISPETESQSKEEFEIDVADISVEIQSRSEDDPRVPLPADDSESKENVDPLSNVAGGDVSLNNSIETGTDNPLRGAERSERIIFQDITEEIQSRAAQFHGDDDDGIFVVEESSDDSDLMNSEDFTEWSSSPIALNQCLTNIDSDLSSELSVAVSPEDVLVERLAKFSISDRLETSNVEASPNMSSEFMQYSRYKWREGVDGSARLFNPVAAALIDAETDDAHFVPISPSP